MKRITPEMCLAAYEKTGAKPDPLTYGNQSPLCCCGIGAVLLAEGIPLLDITDEAYRRFGYSYAMGFGRGFSEKDIPESIWGPRAEEGYADGRAAAEAVFRPTQTLGETGH